MVSLERFVLEQQCYGLVIHDVAMLDVHARIPMVTPDEQRSLHEENAKADKRFWSSLRDMHAENIEGHRGLIAAAERAVAAGKAGIAEADVKTEAAKERLDRLALGEPVPGGFGKPMTLEDVIKATGWQFRCAAS